MHSKRNPYTALRCYESHPPFLIPDGDKTYVVYGGNGKATPPQEVNVYVSLLEGALPHSVSLFSPHRGTLAMKYPIDNYKAPTNARDFKVFIKFLVECLKKGSTLYVGCIGGHGRTGVVLAALYYEITKDPRAIYVVRDQYCHKAVETTTQVNWLVKHYGMEPAYINNSPLNLPL